MSLPSLIRVALLLLATYFLLALQLTNFADDPGLGWHLLTGEWILSYSQIPRIDPFLAGETPRTWISDQWLADIILYIAQNYLGWEMLYALCASLFVFIFFGLGDRLCRQSQVGIIASAFACALAFKAAQVHFILRPVLFSHLFFALVLVVLRQEKRCGMYILPALFLVWCNLHPGFVLGLLCVGVFAVLRRRFVLFFICLLATFVNPYSYRLHGSILALGQSSYFMQLHAEWQPMSLLSFEGWIWSLLTVSVLFSLKKKSGYFDFCVAIIFALWSLRSIRVFPYYALTAIVPLAYTFSEIGKYFLKDAFQDPVNRRVSFPVTVVCLLMLTATFFAKRVPFFDGDYGPSKIEYPYTALDQILSQAPKNEKIFSVPEWGGFIAWYSRGRLKPFIDDRNTLIGEEFYQNYLQAFQTPEKFHFLTTQLSPGVFLLPNNEKNRRLLLESGTSKLARPEGPALYLQ